MSLRPVLAALVFGAIATPVLAADLGARKGVPAAPAVSSSCKETEKTALSADVFGFTSGSDVSDVGAYALQFEYNGAFNRAGFKTGNFGGHLGKIQLSTAFLPCWEIGPYLLGTTSNGSISGIAGDVGYSSIGFGVENKYKILGRATHGFGLTAVFDANYQGFEQKVTQVTPSVSWSGSQGNVTYKLILDKELIASKLFGAINIQVDQIWTGRPASQTANFSSDYVRNSNLTLSAALTYQVIDGLYLGAETRYVRTHNGSFLNTFTGDALYVGPTLYWQATKAVSLSGTWGIQVMGDAKFPSGTVLPLNIRNSDLNLITQNQHIAKVKLAVAF